MTTFDERTIRARAFINLVDQAIRAEETEERWVSLRKAVAFEHILETVAQLCPEALAVIENGYKDFYQRRVDAASQKEAAE